MSEKPEDWSAEAVDFINRVIKTYNKILYKITYSVSKENPQDVLD